MDYVAGIHQPQADTPADWRRDVAIFDLKFGVVDGRLIGPNGAFELVRRRLLRVHLLLRHGAGFVQQVFEALIIQLRVAV